MEGTDALSAGQPRGLLLDGRSGRRNDGDVSGGHGAAGWIEDVDFPDRGSGMERRGVCGAGRWALGSDLQAVPVGVDGARGLRATYRQGRDGVDRAAVEDAAFEQGNSAGAVGIVPAASLFIGSELPLPETLAE